MGTRILVAYDQSPQAAAALEHALDQYPAADLTVIHVTDPSEWIYSDELGGGYYAEGAFEAAKESADELLAQAEADAEAAGREVTSVSEVGPVASTIVEYAEDHDIDHIVIGSHGRRGLSRFLLGSVAEAVARRSPVSITMVREPATESAT